MSANSRARAGRSTGRVTPKGVRPPGVADRPSPAARPGAPLGRGVLRDARPVPSRPPAQRVIATRSGHRGGR